MLTRILNAGQAPSGSQDWKRRMPGTFGAAVPFEGSSESWDSYSLVVLACCSVQPGAFASPVFSRSRRVQSRSQGGCSRPRRCSPDRSETVGEWVMVPSWLESTNLKCFVGHPDLTAKLPGHR